jgi:hypothetical protein
MALDDRAASAPLLLTRKTPTGARWAPTTHVELRRRSVPVGEVARTVLLAVEAAVAALGEAVGRMVLQEAAEVAGARVGRKDLVVVVVVVNSVVFEVDVRQSTLPMISVDWNCCAAGCHGRPCSIARRCRIHQKVVVRTHQSCC